ncbi:DUF502 domain-containing protein [Estrella lausannensis]|uniref:DUF502 domain-containing protein n=1 Tax=Estrella lausannensis TaxID=483423 RepID=A0A0H5DU91_9BACT|nr:DUF502 domain-containing protein [Estrella lausannensis]CRX39489.1 hypothetical protein ELAC_2169 [Estrella lausannensis]
MKRNFITGLIILLPVAMTVWIVSLLLSWLTAPFSGPVLSVFAKWRILEAGFLFIPGETLQLLLSKLLIVSSLVLITLLLGFVASRFFIHFLLSRWDAIIKKIPFISTVYKTSQDVIHTVLKQDSNSFKQVVIVPFPNPTSHAVGFVTKEKMENVPGKEGKTMVGVFVPTTPNPTSGFIVLYDVSEVTYIDMKVEDALKYVISCGAIMNEPFRPLNASEVSNT